MTSLLISLAFLLIVVSVGLLRLKSQPRATAHDSAWLDSFSMDFYRVMERLLRSQDLQFLQSERGCTPALARSFRRKRRRILRCYLQQLQRDFNRIQSVARLKVASSPPESAEMSLFLFQSSLLFSICRLRVECSLFWSGIGGATDVNARPLFAPVEVLLLHIRNTPASL